MDPSLVKGHHFLGLALLEMELFDEAIKHLQRGLNNYCFFFQIHLALINFIDV